MESRLGLGRLHSMMVPRLKLKRINISNSIRQRESVRQSPLSPDPREDAPTTAKPPARFVVTRPGPHGEDASR